MQQHRGAQQGSVAKFAGAVQDIFLENSGHLNDFLGAHEVKTGEDNILFELIQRPGQEDMLSRFALSTGVPFEVVWGGLDRYVDSIAGRSPYRSAGKILTRSGPIWSRAAWNGGICNVSVRLPDSAR